MTHIKPKLIITLGDPAGIGPEVVAKALCEAEPEKFTPIVVGAPAVLYKAFQMLTVRCEVEFETIELPEGVLSPAQRGEYVYAAIKKGVELCLDGKGDALVTGPINKSTLKAAGLEYPGHTEILGNLCSAVPIMMLAGGPLRVIPITTHLPLKDVPERLSRKLVYDTCLEVQRALIADFDIKAPRLAMTGLNPHGGEGGLMGTEEIEIINPALEKLRETGVDIDGALPADTVFYFAAKGDYDAVIAPTHDQALIPLKLLAFDTAVNVTLNLPIIRTSPGHGTAEDIAFTGQAIPGGMSAAIELASMMAISRRKNTAKINGNK